jgi:hypothetical protein
MDLGMRGTAEAMLERAMAQVDQFDQRAWVKAAATMRNINIEDIICDAYSKGLVTGSERDEILMQHLTNGRRADLFHVAIDRFLRISNDRTAKLKVLSLFLKSPITRPFADKLFA